MRAHPLGKRVELTPRDLEIFALLERYRYLRSTYLHAFVGGASLTRFKERLGLLFHEGYIGRPAQQWAFAGCRYRPAIYEAAKGSKRALEASGQPSPYAATFLASDGAHRQFQHSLLVSDLLASLELAARECPGLRFVSWGEILARAPAATRESPQPFRLAAAQGLPGLVPDAVFGLEYARDAKRSYRFFALEADRGTMPILRTNPRQTSIAGKLAAYEGCIARGVPQKRWNLGSLLVLVVTNGQPRAQGILEMIAKSPLDARRYLVTPVGIMDEMVQPRVNVLATPWCRAGLADFEAQRI